MTHIEQRYDESAIWAALNPVLHAGEAGHESNTGRWKVGDGLTEWNSLPYKLGVDTVAGQTGEVELGVADVAGAAPTASPEFTGSPKAPTPNTPDNDTSVATTAFVKNVLAEFSVLDDLPTAPTPDTDDDDTSVATTAFVKAALLAAHPVGDIKMTTVNTNPGTYLGGVWAPWGSGRVPVGVNASDPDFDGAEEMGGEKTHTLTIAEMPSQSYGIDASTSLYSGGVALSFALGGAVTNPDYGEGNVVQTKGGDDPHNNLQPYITCYMWKRTA